MTRGLFERQTDRKWTWQYHVYFFHMFLQATKKKYQAQMNWPRTIQQRIDACTTAIFGYYKKKNLLVSTKLDNFGGINLYYQSTRIPSMSLNYVLNVPYLNLGYLRYSWLSPLPDIQHRSFQTNCFVTKLKVNMLIKSEPTNRHNSKLTSLAARSCEIFLFN
jgi:hypothetical protein